MAEKSTDKLAARIGSKIRLWRGFRQKTLRRFGEEIGMDHSTLGKIETGLARPSLDSLLRIAEALSVPPSLLIDAYSDAIAVVGRIDADAWAPDGPFFATEQIYPLGLPHHRDVLSGEAFEGGGTWYACERLKYVENGLREGTACVVYRQKRGKGGNLSLRLYTNNGYPEPLGLFGMLGPAFGLGLPPAPEANLLAAAGLGPPRSSKPNLLAEAGLAASGGLPPAPKPNPLAELAMAPSSRNLLAAAGLGLSADNPLSRAADSGPLTNLLRHGVTNPGPLTRALGKGAEDDAFFRALNEFTKAAEEFKAEADQQARTGWLVSNHGDPSERYLPADDKSIKQVWVICSEFRHVR